MAGNRILQNVLAAIMEGKGGRSFAGNIQEQAQKDLQLLSESYKNPNFYLSNHAMTNRFDTDGWSPEKIAESFERLIGDANTRGIPNFTGRKGTEALWLEDAPTSLMSPVVPYKNGSMAVTLIDPFTEKVLKHLDDVGWKPEGRNHPSSEYTPGHIGHREGSSTQRLRFSAVGDQPETSVRINDTDSRSKVKALLPYIIGGGAAGAATLASPQDAEAVNIGPKGFSRLFGKDLTESTPGAFKGAEGLLRYELPDNNMRMVPEFRREWELSDRSFPHSDWMDNAITHPDLFKAYPELQGFDMTAWRTPEGRSGAAYSDGLQASAPDLKSVMDVIAHENQHAVQGIEGFQTGTTPEIAGGYRQYIDNPGEREARMTEARRRLTAEQRAQNPQQGMDAWNTMLAAGAVTPQKPLEQPTFDPIDNLIAALTGPAGIAGKAVAGAVETPLSITLDKVLEGAGKGYNYLAQRGPQMQGAWF